MSLQDLTKISPAFVIPLQSSRTFVYAKVGQPFQNGGQLRLSRAARGPELQTKTQNEDCILLQYLYCKSGKSVRWLVLLAMEKDINVRLDG